MKNKSNVSNLTLRMKNPTPVVSSQNCSKRTNQTQFLMNKIVALQTKVNGQSCSFFLLMLCLLLVPLVQDWWLELLDSNVKQSCVCIIS